MSGSKRSGVRSPYWRPCRYQHEGAMPPALQPLLSKLLAFLAGTLMKQGKFDEGMTLAQPQIALGKAHEGLEGEAYGWLILGQGCYRKGRYNERGSALANCCAGLIRISPTKPRSLCSMMSSIWPMAGWVQLIGNGQLCGGQSGF